MSTAGATTSCEPERAGPAPVSDEPRSIALLGERLTLTDAAGACDVIVRRSSAGVGGWVITPNLDILRRLVREPEFRELCSDADLRLADGMPLVWASRIRGTPLPERVAGSDLIWRLAEAAAASGRSIYLLGGNPGSADAAARVLTERSPTLRIAGTRCPPLGFEQDSAYMAAMESDLRAVSPDIVFVGLGSPKQELLIRRLRDVLPRAWFLGVGVTFSFTSGDIARAPGWMRRCGLEWLHRLCMEPGRLWKRYLVHGVPFGIRLISASVLDRCLGRGAIEPSRAGSGARP